MSQPRLPWTRGPAAWGIARRRDEIIRHLQAARRNFFSLRRTAVLLGVSTQPVRDCIRLGYLRREGPRGQVAKAELARFVDWVSSQAKASDPEAYAVRLAQRLGPQPAPFDTLAYARFLWPRGRAALSPRELADLVGCHPSLITKAITQWPAVLGRLRTSCRWEITRRAWQMAFPNSQITLPTLPQLPRVPDFSLGEAAEYLRRWGMAGASPYRVRCLAKAGELQMVELAGAGRCRFRIPRGSLEKIRKKHLTRLRIAFSN